MSTNSKIEWTDATWNPVTGCSWASPGCDNCYAATMTRRLAAMGQTKYAQLTTAKHFNGRIATHESELQKPLRWRKPRRVFVNSMSDLFHPRVPFEFVNQVFVMMALAHKHIFQLLTKRPERMKMYFDDHCCEVESEIAKIERKGGHRGWLAGRWMRRDPIETWPLPNVQLGTSVEDQQLADERIPRLLACPATVRFLSCEPLLGPMNLFCRYKAGARANVLKLSDIAPCQAARDDRALHWIIAGGESGPGARPMHPDWVRSIRDQCTAASVPFFFKQWGEFREVEHEAARDGDLGIANNGSTSDWSDDYHPSTAIVRRVGKKRAGRLLDGREWNEFPEVA